MSTSRADVLERAEAKHKNDFMLESLWMAYDMAQERLKHAERVSGDAVIAWTNALSSQDAQLIRDADIHCRQAEAETRRLSEKLSEVYQMMEPYLKEKRRRRFY